MRGRDLERHLAMFGPRSASDLDHIGRALRAADVLPSGGRGPNAPSLTADHIASFVVAAAVARKATDPASVNSSFRAFSGLVPLRVDRAFRKVQTLAGCVARLLTRSDLSDSVEEIRFYHPLEGEREFARSFAAAEIVWKGRDPLGFAPADRAAELVNGRFGGGSTMNDVTIIGGGMLHELAGQLAFADIARRKEGM